MTLTLAPDARRSVGLFSTGLTVADHKPKMAFGKGTKSEKLVLQVTDVPVFRSGTFRDSMGYQHTWENIHIDQMVMHHDHLKNSGIFADVPVRKGHGSFFGDPMDSLIGWHTGLRAETMTSTHDGKEYHYLLASFEIFEEDAAKHVEDGDWRNRSSEVGFYLTNAEAEYWPVYQGFAYVDIPAVEGLNGFSKAVQARSNFSMMIEQEVDGMAGDNSNSGGTGGSTEQQQPPASGEGEQQAAASTTDAPAEQPTQQAAATPETQPAAPAEQPPAETQHAAGGTVQTFKVNGQPVSDFAAVQQHIDTLETAARERETVVRAGFVKQLAADGKISAVQIDALTNHAQGLSPEAYASWSASYDAVPKSGLFGQYGTSGGDGTTTPEGAAAPAAAPSELQTLEGIVAMHSRTMSPEQLKETESYKKLQALKAPAGQN